MNARRSHARLAIIRPGNVLTSVADTAAGFALVGADSVPALALLVAASVSLYAGGITLNDAIDAPRDATLRPERPIPSARITRRAAAVQAATLLAIGVALPAAAIPAVGVAPLAVAIILATSIISYNLIFKHSPLPASLSMGACRGLNLLLGVAAAGIGAISTLAPAALGHIAHISGVTYLARHETGADRTHTRRAAATFALAASTLTAAAWLTAAIVRPDLSPAAAAPFLIAFISLTGFRTLAARRAPSETTVRAAVTSGVLAIVLLDAAIAAAAAGFAYGLLIAAIAPAAWYLSRRFAVT